MKSIETVGILGLGKMGCPLAGHLVAKGFKGIGYDPLAQAREKAIRRGARGAASAREVAQARELVIAVVGFDSEGEEVVFGKEGVLEGARPGLVVALRSTVAPRYSKRVAERLERRDIVLLDIPLARGEAAAVAGKLLVYGAGDHAAFELCKPVFSAFASDIFHLGPAGGRQGAEMGEKLLPLAGIGGEHQRPPARAGARGRSRAAGPGP